MACNSNPAYGQCTIVPRFSVQDGFRTVYMDVPQDGCRLAVSGYNDNTKDTFIDLFALKTHPVSQDKSLLMTSQPYFSKELTKIKVPSWRLRCVCLLDDSVFVTCCGNTIESYDTEHGRLVDQRQFTGEATCMTTTRDGRVYVGLELRSVIVFDRRLNQINKITLKGLQGREYPMDITVNNNKLFICTCGRALMCNINGYKENEFKRPNHQYSDALSTTVSEENGLMYILWSGGLGECVVVVVYSLPTGPSSLFRCHFLASFNVSVDSWRIRINNNVNRLFVVTRETGEVYEYNTNDIIKLENLLTLIELLITKDNCQKLLHYFKVPADKAKTIQESDEPSKALLQHLRNTGKISADPSLLTASNDKEISQVKEAWTNYQQFISHQKGPLLLKQSEKQRKQLTKKLKESENDREKLTDRLKETQLEKENLVERLAAGEEQRQQVTDQLKESEDIRVQLTNRLEKVEEERRELTDRLEKLEEKNRELTDKVEKGEEERRELTERLKAREESITVKTTWEKTKSSWRAANDELVNTQVKYAKESMVLQEAGIKKTSNRLKKKILAIGNMLTDYGRLMIDVAEDLTLNNALRLALLFQLPDSEKDTLRRISFIETPGITLINFLKTRNIINMYNVTNLQKGLMRLHLYRTNANYVVPYQKKVDPFQFEENRSPDQLDWPDEETEANKSNETSFPQEYERTEESDEPQNDRDKGNVQQKIEGEEKPRRRQDSQTMNITQPYIEHNINYEGGTITLMGVCLSIPEEALSGDHAITVTAIRDTEVRLPESAQRGRMTPLIKLEPEGQKLRKLARLTISHSVIPEPDRHSVIIFTGQQAQGESQKGIL